ncbi:hypothetical protein LTR10_015985 [Elasticomyces elasticus]|uniref:FAD-binding PCMH-type domain-containing protein n=1 Tax=Exophiala sideris TaxID=1016849 RepID=A0ABR0J1R2_9EURO|nr:hypothetical protein LTR10_015985 [Elasticomyces elasticus]KAK5024677.1 hypothetical protein LTS07_008523 [Exophiala sideris]KAK5030770.1 hypothetical protein LTR13_008124 [Exophiala sideris]KAK5054311.1 hypothetical protein LTR69_008926 [Exophiala sideris]KAK5179713.1 hypothetical protein LTR44_007881 [Eurotiomycetes sp. CCFEE 6388]
MGTLQNELPIVWRHDVENGIYEEARVGRVFNHKRPKRYPRAVVQASEEAHVICAVRLAVELGCRVSARFGGHSWAAWSVRDDAILIDLGNYHHIEFDEDKQIIIISPSTTGKVLADFLSTKSVMFYGGHCPDVGLGGFLLQGGMGWNCKNWGWACEQIAAIDCVTAKGQLVHCDATHHQDLYWAARGAGPGFLGVVTKFYLNVSPSYSNILSSTFIYPVSEYRKVLDWVVKIAPSFDEDTEIVSVACIPAGAPALSGSCILANFLTFKNSDEAARTALKSVPRAPEKQEAVEEVDEREDFNKPTHTDGREPPRSIITYVV